MADFIAVLRKTIDGLSDKSPDMREKVYRKARDTVAAKLAAIDPPPSRIVIERQTKALEDAIRAVEAGYSVQPASDDFESVLAGIEAPAITQAPVAPPAPPPATPVARSSAAPSAPAAISPPEAAVPSPEAAAEPFKIDREPANEPARPSEPPADAGTAAVSTTPHDELVPAAAERPERTLPEGLAGDGPAARRAPLGLIAALVALILVIAGGYGLWLNRGDLGGMIGQGGGTVAESGQPEASPPAPPSQQAEAPAAPASATPEEPEEQAASAAPEQPPVTETAAQQTPKFTQRLLSDGKEVDEGPSEGGQSIGEGSSNAPATQLADNSAAAQPAQPPASPSDQAVPVGQRAIFYEERTSLAEGTADNGSTVWSLVNESPGNDQPPEPAIRAEVNIPSKNVQLKMTIRRNADITLPASHIIEMIFLGNYEGGGIENVLRVALKGSEAAPGNPLIGIPARIADGYFLIALSSSQAEQTTNLELLLRQSWFDIPIIYKSGRRALVTLEKGVPGDKVFQQAIQAWQSASSG